MARGDRRIEQRGRGCRALAAAVIVQALKDIERGSEHAEEAREFLLSAGCALLIDGLRVDVSGAEIWRWLGEQDQVRQADERKKAA